MPFIYRYYSIQIISYVYLFVRGPERLWWSFFFIQSLLLFFPVFFERVESDMWRWFLGLTWGRGNRSYRIFLGPVVTFSATFDCHYHSVFLSGCYTNFLFFTWLSFFFYHNAFTKPFILRCYFSSLARRLWCTNLIQILKYQLKILQ